MNYGYRNYVTRRKLFKILGFVWIYKLKKIKRNTISKMRFNDRID